MFSAQALHASESNNTMNGPKPLLRLKYERQVRCISANSMARQLNMDPGNYSRLENGVKPPSKRVARLLEHKFRLSSDVLFGFA